MMDTPPTIQVVVPTWYVDHPYGPNRCWDSNEVNQPGSTLIAVAIEWTNGGPLVPVTFQGGSTLPLSQGGGVNFVSDAVANQAQVGQQFWVWIAQYNPDGIIFRDRTLGLGDGPNGEGWLYDINPNIFIYGFADPSSPLYPMKWANFFATGKNAYGTILNSVPNQYTFRPLAILGVTTKPTVALIGDSRGAGLGDDYRDGSGFVGNMERAIGPNFAYLQLSRGGEFATAMTSNGARRLQLASLCSHAVENLGGNDILGGVSYKTLYPYKYLFWNQLSKPPSRILTMTFDPVTSSSDYWTSTVNQSPSQYVSELTQYNSFVRGLSNGVNVVDTAKVVEPSWSGTENFSWGNSSYVINSFTGGAVVTLGDGSQATEVVANLTSTAGLGNGCYVAVRGAGGAGGVFAIDAMNATQVQFYQSNFSSQNWGGGGTLVASFCASDADGGGIADGVHANSTGYRKIASSGILSPTLFV
jgi:lysophospholipase L1-like esterase